MAKQRKDWRKPLTAAYVRTIRQPGTYGDGGRGSHGLYLRVWTRPNGRTGKAWAQRLMIGGKVTCIGLGNADLVTLADARAKALENRRETFAGRDPRALGIPSFADAAAKVIRLHSETWKAGSRLPHKWEQTLRDYAFPKIGAKRIDTITTADVLAVLVPIWSDKRPTAQAVRTRIGAVMKWAVAKGYREDNPAGDAIGAALPRNGAKTVHHRAMPHAEVGAALAKVRASTSKPATRLCLEFLTLTAVRSGEARGATWDEIDTAAKLWTIPGERMKTGAAHRVPLSARALEILAEARKLSKGSGLVFPGKGGGEISSVALSGMLRRLGLAGTVHGFRSSFRDWAGDTGEAREIAEAALAHVVGGVEGSYFRSDLLARRRALMFRWADYLIAQ